MFWKNIPIKFAKNVCEGTFAEEKMKDLLLLNNFTQ